MRRALIGHTGFVGSNLQRQLPFTDRYNSRNFRDMAGQRFDELVCAGVQAVKWWANQNPDQDWAGIAPLLEVLDTVQADRVTLISTVDVYRLPVGVDEATLPDRTGLHTYGLHRLQVEDRLRARFPNLLILRLPGLFGPGLKKNLIFDALNGKNLDGFHAASQFQFYDLLRLGDDLRQAQDAGLDLVNLAVEPVSVADVVQALSGRAYTHHTDAAPIAYDMRTRHAAYWGGSGAYLEDKRACLGRIAAFAGQIAA